MKSLPVKGFGEFTTIFEKLRSYFSYPHLVHNFFFGMKSEKFFSTMSEEFRVKSYEL